MLHNIYNTFTDLFPEFISARLQHGGFKRYFKNTTWSFSGRIITMVVAFFVTAIVGRYLGPTNYGLLSYSISFAGLFSFLATLGVDAVLLRDLVKHPEREKEYLGTALLIRLIAGIGTAIIIICATFLLPEEPIVHALISIIALSYIFQAFTIVNYPFHAKVETKYTIIVSTAVAIILSILKIAIVFSNKGVYFFSAIYVIEPILYAILLLVMYRKHYGNPFDWRFNRSTAIEILKESFPLMLTTVFVIIYSRIDQVMLKYMVNITAVGLYDAAVRLSELWYFLPGVIIGSVFPSIINAQKTEIAMYARRTIYLTIFLTLISVIVGTVVTIFSKEIMTLVFGIEFINGHHALQLYVWSGVGISIGMVLSQYLVNEKLALTLLYTSIIGMVLNVGLNFILIPQYGINGSAFATLISYILGPLSVLLFPTARQRILELFKYI